MKYLTNKVILGKKEGGEYFQLWRYDRNSCHLDTTLAMLMCVKCSISLAALEEKRGWGREYLHVVKQHASNDRDTQRNTLRENIKEAGFSERDSGFAEYHKHLSMLLRNPDKNKKPADSLRELLCVQGNMILSCSDRKGTSECHKGDLFGSPECKYRVDDPDKVPFGCWNVKLDGELAPEQRQDTLDERLAKTILGVSNDGTCSCEVQNQLGGVPPATTQCSGQRTVQIDTKG